MPKWYKNWCPQRSIISRAISSVTDIQASFQEWYALYRQNIHVLFREWCLPFREYLNIHAYCLTSKVSQSRTNRWYSWLSSARLGSLIPSAACACSTIVILKILEAAFFLPLSLAQCGCVHVERNRLLFHGKGLTRYYGWRRWCFGVFWRVGVCCHGGDVGYNTNDWIC